MRNIPTVILAGGKSQRFGADKALACLNGTPLVEILLGQLSLQTSGPIAINCSPDSELSKRSEFLVPDRIGPDLGPLAGIHTAMHWAKELGFDQVITVPVDAPILPVSFVDRLGASATAAISRDHDRAHFLHGIWPVGLCDDLEEFLNSGGRAAKHWSEHCGARICDFSGSDDPALFFNVNSPDELHQLQSAQAPSPR